MSSLKVSLAQLGLVTLTAGALASPALAADFSPLEQPLESDFFIHADAGKLVFGDGDVVTDPEGKPRTEKEASATLLDKVLGTEKTLLIGKNLYQDDSLVAGVFGRFVNEQNKILAESPVGVGGYLAYSDLAEDGTGLKLGAMIAYDRELGAFADASEASAAWINAEASFEEASAAVKIAEDGEKTASGAVTAAKAEDKATAETAYATAQKKLADAKAAEVVAKDNLDIAKRKLAVTRKDGVVTAKLFESYALVLGEVAGNPLRLTQTATLTAKQDLSETDAKTGKTIDPSMILSGAGSVTLSTQLDQLTPSLTVQLEQEDFDAEKAKLSIGGQVDFQATDQIALSLKAGAGRAFGEATTDEDKKFAFSHGAALSFQASEGASISLAIDSFKAGKDKGTEAKGDKPAVPAKDITAYAVGLGLDLRF